VKRTLVAIMLFVLALSAAQAQKLTGQAQPPLPIYSKWFSEYSAAHPGVEINYQSIGSAAASARLPRLVDFGASDARHR